MVAQLMTLCSLPMYSAAERTDEAIALYRTRYLTVGKYKNVPYSGIREALETLRADGHRLFVATSKPEPTSIDILKHFDLDGYFEIICGATYDLSRSEKSDVIAHLLKKIYKEQRSASVRNIRRDQARRRKAERGISRRNQGRSR